MQRYVEQLPAEQRAMLARFHALVLEVHPDARCTWSYKMPTYVVGERRLHVAAWKHGLSVYGWAYGRDGGFAERHPELDNGKGTLKLPLGRELDDGELRALVAGALGP